LNYLRKTNSVLRYYFHQGIRHVDCVSWKTSQRWMKRNQLSSVARHITRQPPLLVLILVPSPTLSQFPGSCKTPYWIFSNTNAYHWRLRLLSLHITVPPVLWLFSHLFSETQHCLMSLFWAGRRARTAKRLSVFHLTYSFPNL